MKLHLVCNQNLHRWEVRNDKEELIYHSSLKGVNEWLKLYNIVIK